jgi:uncharacterized protein
MVEVPETAAWRLVDAHVGFEVVFIRREGDGYRVDGDSTGVEAGEAWGVQYSVALDGSWTTLSARVVARSVAGVADVMLDADGVGGWTVDGKPATELAGCLDVDLEGSAFTNALPVHRLGLELGRRAEAPAAYVRAPSLRVERLEQSYVRLEDDGGRQRYVYASPGFDYEDELTYDEHGLVLDYPGIAARAL